MAIQVQRHLFTANEYEDMAASGILTREDHVELIEGDIVKMAAVGAGHAACVKRLNWLFAERLQASQQAIISVQDPIRLDDYSEPEPDLALVRARADFYAEAHPTAEDVFLLIEVAETSLEYDKQVKVPLYARAGIPEVWVVDLSQGVLHVYGTPANGEYQRQLSRGDRVFPHAFPELELEVDTILF